MSEGWTGAEASAVPEVGTRLDDPPVTVVHGFRLGARYRRRRWGAVAVHLDPARPRRRDLLGPADDPPRERVRYRFWVGLRIGLVMTVALMFLVVLWGLAEGAGDDEAASAQGPRTTFSNSLSPQEAADAAGRILVFGTIPVLVLSMMWARPRRLTIASGWVAKRGRAGAREVKSFAALTAVEVFECEQGNDGVRLIDGDGRPLDVPMAHAAQNPAFLALLVEGLHRAAAAGAAMSPRLDLLLVPPPVAGGSAADHRPVGGAPSE